MDESRYTGDPEYPRYFLLLVDEPEMQVVADRSAQATISCIGGREFSITGDSHIAFNRNDRVIFFISPAIAPVLSTKTDSLRMKNV